MGAITVNKPSGNGPTEQIQMLVIICGPGYTAHFARLTADVGLPFVVKPIEQAPDISQLQGIELVPTVDIPVVLQGKRKTWEADRVFKGRGR